MILLKPIITRGKLPSNACTYLTPILVCIKQTNFYTCVTKVHAKKHESHIVGVLDMKAIMFDYSKSLLLRNVCFEHTHTIFIF